MSTGARFWGWGPTQQCWDSGTGKTGAHLQGVVVMFYTYCGWGGQPLSLSHTWNGPPTRPTQTLSSVLFRWPLSRLF